MASSGGKRLLAAHDLEHARMRHADALRDGAEAHALRVGLPNGNAPSLLGLGAFAGEAAELASGSF